MYRYALLGGPESGKTTSWAGIFHEFRDAISMPPLTPKAKELYRRWNVDTQVGFRVSVPDGDLKTELLRNSELLDQKPIRVWPQSTTKLLDHAALEMQFDFVDINGEPDGAHCNRVVKSYRRKLEIYDPPGGVFTGRHERTKETLTQLATCDGAIAFLPMNVLLGALDTETIEEEDLKLAIRQLVLAPIREVLLQIRQRGHYGDIFPVCFVISKADMCDQDQFARIEDLLYNPDYGVISRLSADNPDMMMCVVPMSILNPETGNFKAMNLQWPFLFAAAATIFRNHSELMAKAAADRVRADDYHAQAAANESKAREHDAAAEALKRRGWFNRFALWLGTGERVGTARARAGTERREAADKWNSAQSYRNSAGRKVELAADDKALARDTWAVLAVEGRHRNVKIFVDGRSIEDISVLLR